MTRVTGFKTYLLEYLTDEQRSRYKNVEMMDKARADTDHFFGVGNDKVHGEVHNDDKSEIHKQLENHLNRDLTHDEYKSGITKDKYGRDVKLGRMIKDDNLRNQFDKDPSRKVAHSNLKTTTVRGVEVAGQTNSAPNAEHPNGHSWGQMSCKNVDTGINRNYLDREISHGTVAHFVHDHNGQEIYRATLHPHHNGEHTAYSVDAEYGIKHPEFTKSAHSAAEKLSGEYVPGAYKKNEFVYNDNGAMLMLHPKASVKEVHKALKSDDHDTLVAAAQHPNLKGEALDAALRHNEADVRVRAAKHPNLSGDTLTNALKSNTDSYVVRTALRSNPNITKEHLHAVLDNNNVPHTKAAVFEHSKVDASHITKGLNDVSPTVREAAIMHPKANEDHIDKASHDGISYVKSAALRHPNVTTKNIDKWLDRDEWDVREAAATHPKASDENLKKAIGSKDSDLAYEALSNPNIKEHHLDLALNHPDETVRRKAVRHELMTPEKLHHVLDNESSPSVRKAVISNKKSNALHALKGLNDPDVSVRQAVAFNSRINASHIKKALKDESHKVREAVLSNWHVDIPSDDLHNALKDSNEEVRLAAIQHPSAKPEHLAFAAASDPSESNRSAAYRRHQRMTETPQW